MPRRVRLLSLTYLCLMFVVGSEGQGRSPEYSILNYNSDNALPQNSINDMAFDRNGFLWLATEMGVVRFDGRNFREYNRSNSPALGSDRCSLVIQERTTGMVLIEPVFSSHRYLTVTADYQLKADTPHSFDRHYLHFGDNELFLYSRLYHRWAEKDPGVFNGLFDRLDQNSDLITVNETQAYVRKGRNFYFLDEAAGEVRLLPAVSGHEHKMEFMVGEVYICVDRQNHLYAYKDGILQNITGSARLLNLLGEVDVNGPYPIQAKLKTMRDSRHSFMVHRGDILLLHLSGGVLDLELLAADTPIRDINCLIYDQRNKIIFAGTATSGLYILKRQEFRPMFFSSDNYSINSLYGQVELPNGNILTSSGILDRHAKTNIPTPGIYDRAAFLQASDGAIWYSSYGWLIRADTGLRHAEKIVSLGDISVCGIWVTSFAEMAGKDILCSTLDKLYRVRGKTASLLLDAKPFLKDGEIMVIRPVNDHELWIGTSVGGYSFDLVHRALHPLPGMERTAIRSIYIARDGSRWVGTYGQGFYKYVQSRFVRMPLDRGNKLANVHCFMEDRQGSFWLPTNKGLFRVSKRDLDRFAAGDKVDVYYYYFDKSAGFRSNEFNGGCSPCGIITADGHFSLPSLDGLIQFQPDSITMTAPDHPIFIERLAMDNKKTLAADGFEQGQDSGPLTFSISSPYYGNPANLHLEYRIPELDDNWHPVSDDGKLVLTGLRRGRSRYSYQTVHWTIPPYGYETTAFRLVAALVLISILPVMIYRRLHRQVRRAEVLEEKVAERTATLSESNRVKEKMIAIILHDLRSPLRFLHLLATHIHESHRRVTGPELEDMLGKFQNATHDLYTFTQDFVVWTNAQKEGFVIQQERVGLKEVVGEIVSLYEPGADLRNNTVLNLVPETIDLVTDPHILKLLIRNLIDNSNKYTYSGEIRIEAGEADSAIGITIADSGRSMEKELVADILNNRYRSGNDTHGFGYTIILELLARIHGRLQIETPAGGGNRITLLFLKAPR